MTTKPAIDQSLDFGIGCSHMDKTGQSSVLRRVIKWLVLIAFIVVALHYLKSAIYGVWLSGWPDPQPPGLSRRVIGQLCFALASLSFGLGLFKGVQTFPAATAGSAALIVLGAVLALGPYIERFVLIDRCLDGGGSWNRVTRQCFDE
jgi:hypothetical protein